MGLNTKIEYADSTHNFWYGCTKISEGCKNCFAERIYKRFYGNNFNELKERYRNFDAPLKWKKPRVILVNDMSDFFHDDVPLEWQEKAFEIMWNSSDNAHQYLLLTKRPKNMNLFFAKLYRKYPRLYSFSKELKNNIWLGVSVENQKTADERIPELLKIPYFKKWISFEPLLEMIDTSRYLHKINWAIVGGETGIRIGVSSLRFIQWAKYLKEQCKSACVPFFFKQMPCKGVIPKDLMVREYPKEIRGINDIHG